MNYAMYFLHKNSNLQILYFIFLIFQCLFAEKFLKLT